MAKHDIHKIYEYRWDWSSMPFLRMLIALIVGILLYDWIEIRTIFIPIGLALLLLVYFFLLWINLAYRHRLLYGIMLQVMTILFGYSLASYQDGQKDADHFSNYITDEYADVYGLITELKERTTRYEAVVCIHQVATPNRLSRVSGKLNAYISYKDIDTALAIGQHIAIKAKIIQHPEPKNPEVFDYGHYLSKKHIYHQTENVSEVNMISECEAPKFWMSRHRTAILESMHEHIDDQSNYSIAASIILGYRDAVDYETKRAFAETGSIHILAVSGMHVGIIFLVIGLLINRINNRKKWYKYLRFALFSIGIWGFVLLAGVPPSALRAAWLFTLILLGGLISGKSNLYHRLAIAAFLMLQWNTNYIYDVGFQLSFTAILGIAAILPIWNKLYEPQKKVSQYLWDGMGMTIGATLGTVPLTIYYFHYFPITGLFSSILVIAFATIILQLGVVFLILFWLTIIVPELTVVLGFIGDSLNYVIGALQSVVHFFHDLPLGLIEGISLSILSVLLLYTLMVSVRMLLDASRKKIFVYASVLSFTGLGIVSFSSRYMNDQIQEIVIYHDYRNNAIELFDGGRSLLISDEPIIDRYSAFLNKGIRIDRQIATSTEIVAADAVSSKSYAYYDGALKFGNHQILIINDRADIFGKSKVHWDYILLADNAAVSIEDLFDELSFDEVLFGASNWQSNVERWIKECKQMDIGYVDIKNTKALVINVKEEKI